MKLSISTTAALAIVFFSISPLAAAELPANEKVTATKLFEVPAYCEGVVFDHAGNGYISWDKSITRFSLRRQTRSLGGDRSAQRAQDPGGRHASGLRRKPPRGVALVGRRQDARAGEQGV